MTSTADMPGGRTPATPTLDPLASLRHPPRRDRPPADDLERLAWTLAGAYERENHLLNRISVAHATGWGEALREVFARIDASFADADPREIPGLAAAGRILQTLHTATPPPTPHRLDVAIVPGVDAPEYRVGCTAPAGAPCRMACPCAARGFPRPGPGGECDEWCSGVLVDAGHCLAEADLDGGETELFTGYVGVSRALVSGPILVRPTRNGWEWIYAADPPDGATAQEWTRAAS